MFGELEMGERYEDGVRKKRVELGGGENLETVTRGHLQTPTTPPSIHTLQIYPVKKFLNVYPKDTTLLSLPSKTFTKPKLLKSIKSHQDVESS